MQVQKYYLIISVRKPQTIPLRPDHLHP